MGVTTPDEIKLLSEYQNKLRSEFIDAYFYKYANKFETPSKCFGKASGLWTHQKKYLRIAKMYKKSFCKKS
jgi:hypothetical protein